MEQARGDGNTALAPMNGLRDLIGRIFLVRVFPAVGVVAVGLGRVADMAQGGSTYCTPVRFTWEPGSSDQSVPRATCCVGSMAREGSGVQGIATLLAFLIVKASSSCRVPPARVPSATDSRSVIRLQNTLQWPRQPANMPTPSLSIPSSASSPRIVENRETG